MEQIFYLLIINLSTVMLMMFLGWIFSLPTRNVSIVDSLWGVGFVLVVWITFFLSDGYIIRKWLICVLTTLWGIRLCVYLSWRNWGAGEDPRYGMWRQQSGDRFWIVSLFKVFLLQAAVLWVISLTLQFGQIPATPGTLTAMDVIGTVLWAIGFFFETVGDWQLARFKADPANRGRVMNRGLWAYTRHPNYFGECLIWWGIYMIALSNLSAWWTLISPVFVTLVLLKMTGIPLTEKSIVEKRPAYQEYIETTSAFIPWFQRKSR